MTRGAVAELATCVAVLASGACGRISFDVPTATDGGSLDAALDAPARIAYIGPFVQRDGGTGATDSFLAQAHGAGNAIVIQVACASQAVPTAVSVTAPGWTFTELGPITASTSSRERSATLVAIAPNTVRATFTVTWSGSTCGTSKNHVGDEFAMTDRSGGAITFDGTATTMGTGNCVGSVTTGHAGDAVWAACDSDQSVNAIGAGFIKGADDAVGDWSEYKITDDPAGTVEAVQFGNDNVGYVLSMVTLKAQ
jgi:hypothetical protein